MKQVTDVHGVVATLAVVLHKLLVLVIAECLGFIGLIGAAPRRLLLVLLLGIGLRLRLRFFGWLILIGSTC